MSDSRILLGKGQQPVHLLARYGNRHGLVAGATGTGKTVTLMVMAEGFSRLGVPMFLADVKGDVAGLAMPGVANDKVKQRAAQIGVDGYVNEASPVVFWDLYGKAGHPVRTTVSEIGPTLLSRILQVSVGDINAVLGSPAPSRPSRDSGNGWLPPLPPRIQPSSAYPATTSRRRPSMS